jgi:uncharacterized protein DUF742
VREHNRWLDQQAGPVVRPYALTGGRTVPAGEVVLDLISVVAASRPRRPPADALALTPEHRRLVDLCQEPATVADVTADMTLPLGVVRVLLADLIAEGLIAVRPLPAVVPRARQNLLQEVLDGLRSL